MRKRFRKTKFFKRLGALTLAYALVAGMLPQIRPVSQTAYAMNMESGVASLTVNQTQVAFAGHEWWVIGYNGSGVYSKAGDNHVTLLAANLDEEFKNIPFRTGGYDSFDHSTKYQGWYYANNPDEMNNWTTPNEYTGSTLQQRMVSIAESFPAKEQAVIAARDFASGATADNNWAYEKTDYLDGMAGQGVSGQKLWAISEAEWNTINNATVHAYGDYWWLRSPSPYNGAVARQGNPLVQSLDSAYVLSAYDAIRPALRLNLESVLFTSAAAGGKSSATAGGSLTETTTPNGTVKFTMLDDSQTLTVNATNAQRTQTGKTLSFTYSNATTGANQYVSCVLTDESGNVKYYGKLADSSGAASGDLSIPLTGVVDGTYTLQIFSEEANGDMYTDFCSQPVTMTLAVKGGTGTVSNFGGTVMHDHNWSSDWSTSDTHHWHNCTAADCPITDDSKKDGYAEHTYNKQVVDDKYKVSDADCTHAETYYYSCECGAKGTVTFENGDALGHDWSVWSSNNGTHTRTCSVCHAPETENCDGGTATCTAQAVCTDCKQPYGDKDPTNHSGSEGWVQTETTHKKVYSCCNVVTVQEEEHEWVDGTCSECGYGCLHTGGTATCTGYAICDICGQPYGSLEPANHTENIDWTQTETKHTGTYDCCQTIAVPEEDHEWADGKCSECGYECKHTGGTATCVDKAVCDICGGTYGDINAINHTNLLKTDAKPATHMTEGNIEYRYCSGCDKYFSDSAGTQEIEYEDTIIPRLTEHTADGTGWHYDENGHWNTCECGAKINEAAHTCEWITDKTPTATEAGARHEQCTVCGYAKAAVEIPATGTPVTEEPATGAETTTEAQTEASTEAPKEAEVSTAEPTTEAPKDTGAKTGDDADIAFWATLLLVSAFGMACAGTYGKKRKDNR